MRCVVVESPYGRNVDGTAADAATIERNLRYLRACLADCLGRNESPVASHGLLIQPGVLDDRVHEERERGLAAGWAWHQRADLVVFYLDRGQTVGMTRAKARAFDLGVAIENRLLGGEWAAALSRVAP